MLKNLILSGCAAMALWSCGPSKKLKAATDEVAKLNAEVESLSGKLADGEKQYQELKKENDLNAKDAAIYRAGVEAERLKKEKLEQELAARGTSLAEIEAKSKLAVDELRQLGCEVQYKENRFFITIPDDFTFKPSGLGMGPKSRTALNSIAQMLRNDPGQTAVILGNTDTSFNVGEYDNWTLSTERANAVVRVLEDTYNINPARLTSAGRSFHHPAADGNTEEGKLKNRRIEIILNPKFSRLADLIKD